MTRPRVTLVALVLLISVAGCGDDDAGDGPAIGESVELETTAGQILVREPGEDTFYPGVPTHQPRRFRRRISSRVS